MKTRMRRFWMSFALAASSALGSLVPGKYISAHDLPLRWSRGEAGSTSWNYLLDNCLDNADFSWQASSQSHDFDGSIYSLALKESSCFLTGAATRPGQVADFDAILSQSVLTRTSHDLTCWADGWQLMARQAGVAIRSNLSYYSSQVQWAARPDAGSPPEPSRHAIASALASSSANQNFNLTDTCAFEAEYQMSQAASDMLAREIARAATVSSLEARIAQSLRHAAEVEAAMIDRVQDAASEYAHVRTDVQQESIARPSTLVSVDRSINSHRAQFLPVADDGMMNNVIDARCFPESSICGGMTPVASSSTSARLTIGQMDEYLPYDLTETDTHWLGGLGKAWKLQAALRGTSAANIDVADERMATVAPVAELNAADAYTSPEEWSPAVPESLADDGTNWLLDQVGGVVAFARGSIASSIDHRMGLLSRVASELPIADAARNMEDLSDEASRLVSDEMAFSFVLALASGAEQLDNWQCMAACELCGFDSTYKLGNAIGLASDTFVNNAMQAIHTVGTYIDLPVDSRELTTERYVVYVDSEGGELAVPESLARAWNRPEAESLDDASHSGDTELLASFTIDFNVIEDQLLTMAARQLDRLGVFCLQTADQLSDWAQQRIASRTQSSNR